MQSVTGNAFRKFAATDGDGLIAPHSYSAFGMHIRSDVYLPELPPAQFAAADLTIELGETGRPFPEQGDGVVFDFHPGACYLGWPDIAAFLIVGTDRIIVEPSDKIEADYLAFPLLGPVMALVLHLRSLFVLHGSAVQLEKGSAVFIGDKMAGKSTTAAAFVSAGHQLITDDIVAIDLSNRHAPLLMPAFGQLKLASDASAAIGLDDAEKLPLILPGFPKQQHKLNSGFATKPVRPTKIYRLSRGDAIQSIAHSGLEAVAVLMRFSYATRFERRALQGELGATHMRLCGELVQSCAVATLVVPTKLEGLADVVRFVEADVAKIA